MADANSWEGVSLHAKRVGAKFPELVAAQWALTLLRYRGCVL